MITGTTRLLPLVGHPVAQVKSPPAFNAHFSRSGVDAVIFPVDVEPDAAEQFFSNLAGWKNCIGCSVTMPHKQRAFARVDIRTERAEMAGAVNIIRRNADGTLVGDMTDGLAMVAALIAAGFTPAGARALVVGGGGGAGSAIALALCEAGVEAMTILETDRDRSAAITARLGTRFPGIDFSTEKPPTQPVDLVLNATPLGMKPNDSLPVDVQFLSSGTYVADVVTEPVETVLLARARAQGMPTVSGLDMVHWQLPFQMAHLHLPGWPQDGQAA
ncbi:shikimate dehydrogenase [Pelagibacterium halotolerans]|nr:shikimate dehydrogenase [Pelagibacterium halotolerans]SEA67785.1 shikimate dehydrogenase [Pelagibacterium halotolerans]